jgi:hypothetical protein
LVSTFLGGAFFGDSLLLGDLLTSRDLLLSGVRDLLLPLLSFDSLERLVLLVGARLTLLSRPVSGVVLFFTWLELLVGARLALDSRSLLVGVLGRDLPTRVDDLSGIRDASVLVRELEVPVRVFTGAVTPELRVRADGDTEVRVRDLVVAPTVLPELARLLAGDGRL